MAESSHTPEASEGPVNTESDRTRYERIVDRAQSWGYRQEFPHRYDAEDWSWHFFVGFGGVIGPALRVAGSENVPLPRQPNLIDRIFKGAKPVPNPENKTDAGFEWTIHWGPKPEDKYIVYYKIPHERPEGLKGKTPAIENGLYSATGIEPKAWTFPKAEGCKKVNVFDVTEKMLDVLEKSRVHQQGVHGRPKA